MAGGVFSSALLNAMTIRESANDGSDFSNPTADYRRLFLGEDGLLHLKDSAGTVTDIGAGAVATDTIWDAAGDLVQGTGANAAARLALGTAGQVLKVNAGATAVEWGAPGSVTGMVPIVPAPGFRLSPSATDNTASRGLLCPVSIPGTMRLRNLVIRTTATGAGTHEWGLFDYSSNAASCTKLAGGSGALGATGWTAIAASGAPVTINPGNYALIFKWPSSTAATISVSDSSVANKLGKVQASYTWDDTPDLTSGWSDHTSVIVAYLHGDLNASATW